MKLYSQTPSRLLEIIGNREGFVGALSVLLLRSLKLDEVHGALASFSKQFNLLNLQILLWWHRVDCVEHLMFFLEVNLAHHCFNMIIDRLALDANCFASRL